MADEKHEPHPSELLDFNTMLNVPDLAHIENGKTHASDDLPGFITTPDTLAEKKAYEHRLSQVTTHDRRYSAVGLNVPRINSSALAAAQSEHKMTLRQGLQQYPRAIFWSMVISLAIVGEAFDTGLINSFYGFPEFTHAYGIQSSNGSWQITTKWQTSLNNGAVAGSILGLLANGWLTERFGYRKTLMGAVIALGAFIFLAFFAYNIETLLAAQVLCGVPWGICSTLTMSYAAEVMPLALRGYLTANVNMCWLLGQIVALGTLRGFISLKSNWSYRIPFGLQWVWIVIVLIGAWAAPESPWYLVRKGRDAEAKHSLDRLSRGVPGKKRAAEDQPNLHNILAMMKHTNEVEKQLNGGKGNRNDLSYFECFRGTNLRRTEIACAIFMIQNMCGLPLISFAVYVYRQVGFDVDKSFDLTLGMHFLAVCGSLLCMVLIKHYGRRTLFLIGLSASLVILLIVGILGTVTETPSTLWAIAAFLILFIFVFDTTMGPLTYVIVAEIPSTRLRVNTVVLARISYNLNALVTNVITQHALNPLSWNWRAKTGFFFVGTNIVCILYCYFRLPESKGLTYHELDILFEKKANARKFSSIQKRLEETGYFGFYEAEGAGRSGSHADVAWHK